MNIYEERLENFKKDLEKVKEQIYEIENDLYMEDKQKKSTLAILNFNKQELYRFISELEIKVKIDKNQEKYMKEQRELDRIREAEEAKFIIPRRFNSEIAELKRLQDYQKKEQEDLRRRAKSRGMTVDEENLTFQNRALATTIYNKLAYMATTKEIKKELTRIFNIKF